MSARDVLSAAEKTVLFTVVTDREETMHVAIGDISDRDRETAMGAAQDALSRGHMVRWPDGSEQWRAKEVIHPLHWNEEGNKVLHEIVRVTRLADGTIKRTPFRKVWAKF